MQTDIQSQGFTLTDGLRDYVVRRLSYNLHHGSDTITRVTVRLSDINGPRGGADKRCLIQLRLKAAPEVMIEDIEADLYVAIDRAAERAGRALARCLERRREFAPGMSVKPANEAHAAQADIHPDTSRP